MNEWFSFSSLSPFCSLNSIGNILDGCLLLPPCHMTASYFHKFDMMGSSILSLSAHFIHMLAPFG